MDSEEAGKVKMIVRLTVLDNDMNESNSSYEDVTSDIEVSLSQEDHRVSALKAILEAEDLLPSEDELEEMTLISQSDNNRSKPSRSFSVEVRVAPTSRLLLNDDILPDGVEVVYVKVTHHQPTSSSPSAHPTPPLRPCPPSANLLRPSILPVSPPLVQPFAPACPSVSSTRTTGATSSGQLPPSVLATLMNQAALFSTTTRQQPQQQQAPSLQGAWTSGLMNDPSMMRQLMNSPMMRSMVSNPELLRTLMDSNPQMRELRERNPELNHLLNDPELLRQSMDAMQNPSLMREMVNNTDRALSNIDAVPGGFNALRRVYQQIQEPIWDAAIGSDNAKNNANKQTKHYDLLRHKKPSTEAIPNPWGGRPSPAPPATPSFSPSSASRIQRHSHPVASGLSSSFVRPPSPSTSLLPTTCPSRLPRPSIPTPPIPTPPIPTPPIPTPMVPLVSVRTHTPESETDATSTAQSGDALDDAIDNMETLLGDVRSSLASSSSNHCELSVDKTETNSMSPTIQSPASSPDGSTTSGAPPHSPSSSFTAQEASSEPRSELLPSERLLSESLPTSVSSRGDLLSPSYPFQSFFNPQLRLRSLGGLGFLNAGGISSQQQPSSFSSSASVQHPSAREEESHDKSEKETDNSDQDK